MIKTVSFTRVYRTVLLASFLLCIPSLFAQSLDKTTTPHPRTNEAQAKQNRFLFNVTLHTKKEIESLLQRAETLSQTMRFSKHHADIALVLHGSEIKFFNKQNYKKYRNIVDLAARLDADRVIKIKVCRTRMKTLNIKDNDIPSFIEIIPFGPDEEQRLIRKGYIYL